MTKFSLYCYAAVTHILGFCQGLFMPGSPRKRARKEAQGLPVAPRMTINLNPVVLRKMRERGADVEELTRLGMNDANRALIMGYGPDADHGNDVNLYIPTSEEREAVQNWVVAGYKTPLKLKEMLLEDFDLDLTVSVIQRAFRVELLLGKERIAVEATKNVISAIKEGDVNASFRFLESAGKWQGKDAPAPGNVTFNTQINVTAETAVSEYQKLVKGG